MQKVSLSLPCDLKRRFLIDVEFCSACLSSDASEKHVAILVVLRSCGFFTRIWEINMHQYLILELDTFLCKRTTFFFILWCIDTHGRIEHTISQYWSLWVTFVLILLDIVNIIAFGNGIFHMKSSYYPCFHSSIFWQNFSKNRATIATNGNIVCLFLSTNRICSWKDDNSTLDKN